MKLFSERYGYTKPSDVIIRERITPEIQNAICTWYDELRGSIRNAYEEMELHLWTKFLNQRQSTFYGTSHIGYRTYRYVAVPFIDDDSKEWHEKLSLIEESIQYLLSKRYGVSRFCQQLNNEFERLNFAYRIVDNVIVEINSQEEIGAIERALEDNHNNVRLHLDKALQLYSQRDYRNSIKESISAVEVICREKTGEKTLGKALNKLEASGNIPKFIKEAFERLYTYTNQPDTGIRHAFMDNEGSYAPTSREAILMIVTCSAFINYVNQSK